MAGRRGRRVRLRADGDTVAVTIAGIDTGAAGLAASGRALMVLVPVGVGCYAWYRRPH